MLEIEDTGVGIPEEKQRRLEEEMNHADIEMLKTRSHVGMINACLRMKKTARSGVRFVVESEENIGTTVTIVLEEVRQHDEERDDTEGPAG